MGNAAMSAIRVIIQNNGPAGADGFETRAGLARASEGCLQYELYQSLEFPENLIQLELWDSVAAFDAHWTGLLTSTEELSVLGSAPDELCAPYHLGLPSSPRRQGVNGIEIYPHSHYARQDDVWVPAAEPKRPRSVRWPARSGTRILVRSVLPPDHRDHLVPGAIATRQEKGCLQFEYFQSTSDENRLVLAELWDSPRTYDEHFLLRIRQQRSAPPPTGPKPTGLEFEWYQHTYYARCGAVWQPEKVGERMSTVRW